MRARRRCEVPGLPGVRAGECRVPRLSDGDISVRVPRSRKGSADSVVHARSARSARRDALRDAKSHPAGCLFVTRGRMYLHWLRLLRMFGEEPPPHPTFTALRGPHIRPRGSAHEIGGNA